MKFPAASSACRGGGNPGSQGRALAVHGSHGRAGGRAGGKALGVHGTQVLQARLRDNCLGGGRGRAGEGKHTGVQSELVLSNQAVTSGEQVQRRRLLISSGWPETHRRHQVFTATCSSVALSMLAITLETPTWHAQVKDKVW